MCLKIGSSEIKEQKVAKQKKVNRGDWSECMRCVSICVNAYVRVRVCVGLDRPIVTMPDHRLVGRGWFSSRMIPVALSMRVRFRMGCPIWMAVGSSMFTCPTSTLRLKPLKPWWWWRKAKCRGRVRRMCIVRVGHLWVMVVTTARILVMRGRRQ